MCRRQNGFRFLATAALLPCAPFFNDLLDFQKRLLGKKFNWKNCIWSCGKEGKGHPSPFRDRQDKTADGAKKDKTSQFAFRYDGTTDVKTVFIKWQTQQTYIKKFLFKLNGETFEFTGETLDVVTKNKLI